MKAPQLVWGVFIGAFSKRMSNLGSKTRSARRSLLRARDDVASSAKVRDIPLGITTILTISILNYY